VPAITEIERIADALRVSLSLLIRRLRQSPAPGDLTLRETAALKRLELHGAMTLTALAKLEEISAQSMGATIDTLQDREFVKRSADPNDGRQTIVSLTKAGRGALVDRRNAFTQRLAAVLAGNSFTDTERATLLAAAPLIERLAQHL
jgi:DNA-binding MarR family transcriptional regulator